MNAGRPIFPEILEIALAASVVAIAVMIAHIYLFARWQSLIGKVLSTVGVVCLYSVIAAPLLGFALIGWYGGKPDAVASADGHFYVRQKYQLSPVSPAEYHRLQRLFDFRLVDRAAGADRGGVPVGFAAGTGARAPSDPAQIGPAKRGARGL